MYVALQNTPGGTTLVPAGYVQQPGPQLYMSDGLQKQNIITLQNGAGTPYITSTGAQQLVINQGFQMGQGQRYVQVQQASMEQGANGVQLVRVGGQPQQLQQVRVVNTVNTAMSGPRTLVMAQPNGTSMAMRPVAPGPVMQAANPGTTTLMRPVGNATTVIAGAPPALRPLIARVPRQGTVQTYNPATGTVMQPGNAPSMVQAQTAVPMRAQGTVALAPAGMNQPQVVRVQTGAARPDVGGRILQAASAQQQQQLVMQNAPSGQAQPQLVNQMRHPVTVMNGMQLQQVHNSAPRGTAMIVSGAGNGPVQLVRVTNGQVIQANGQQLVPAQFVDQQQQQLMAQQQYVARMVDAQGTQPRNTVLKVPVSAAQGMLPGLQQMNGQGLSNSGLSGTALSGSGMVGMPDVRTANLRLQQQLEQQQQLQRLEQQQLHQLEQQQLAGQMLLSGRDGMGRPISVPLMQAIESGTLMMDGRPVMGMQSRESPQQPPAMPLSADMFQMDGAVTGLSGIPLMRGISAPLASLAGSSLTGSSPNPSSNEDAASQGAGSNSGRHSDPASQASGAGKATGAAGAGGEDLQHILASIGVELARHGISVDAAVSAGWLGALSPRDVALLSEAYAEEEGRIAGEAAGLGGSSVNGAANGLMNGKGHAVLLGGAPGANGNSLNGAHVNILRGGSAPGGPAGIAHALSVGSSEDARSVQASNSSPPPSTAPAAGLQLGALGGLTAEQLAQLQGTGALAANPTSLPYSGLFGAAAGSGHGDGVEGGGTECDAQRFAGSGVQDGKLGSAAAAADTPLADRFANLDLGCGFF